MREELKTPGRSGRRGKSVREWLVLGTRSARGVALERTRRRARYLDVGPSESGGVLRKPREMGGPRNSAKCWARPYPSDGRGSLSTWAYSLGYASEMEMFSSETRTGVAPPMKGRRTSAQKRSPRWLQTLGPSRGDSIRCWPTCALPDDGGEVRRRGTLYRVDSRPARTRRQSGPNLPRGPHETPPSAAVFPHLHPGTCRASVLRSGSRAWADRDREAERDPRVPDGTTTDAVRPRWFHGRTGCDVAAPSTPDAIGRATAGRDFSEPENCAHAAKCRV